VIFARRGNRGPDPFLERKVQVLLAGGALALIGIGVDSSLLVGLAILVLLAGVVFRLLAGREAAADEEVPDERKDPGLEDRDGDPPQHSGKP
jgi:hypothetical protein